MNLGCGANGGPNNALDEMGPSYVEVGDTALLYFSSGSDIYGSERQADGSFGPAAPVSELNTAASDIQPNVRKDGLEVVFASNRRAGTDQDLYVATRDSVDAPFSAPVNLGDAVNTTTASETRPSLSWDGTVLLFGRAPKARPISTSPPGREPWVATEGWPSKGVEDHGRGPPSVGNWSYQLRSPHARKGSKHRSLRPLTLPVLRGSRLHLRTLGPPTCLGLATLTRGQEAAPNAPKSVPGWWVRSRALSRAFACLGDVPSSSCLK